jgi:uncharacterized membrane protein YeaQ/YmgE (transglycosylase-associated protein family)
MSIVWFLIVGLIAGWLAGQFMKGSGFGLIGNMIIGVLGRSSVDTYLVCSVLGPPV